MAEIEHLTKQQIILLVLLACIITAIATSTITVSIMDKQETGVVNTVNRVVEHTIEKVISPATTTVIKQTEHQTIIISVDEQTSKAAQKASKSVARMYLSNSQGKTGEFVGLGVIINNEGLVAVDSSMILPSAKYEIKYGTATTTVAVTVLSKKTDSTNNPGVTFVKPTVDQKINPEEAMPAIFSDAKLLNIGQNVFAISGERNNFLAGYIESISETDGSLNTSILESKTHVGSGLYNLGGELIGFKTAYLSPREGNTFISSNLIKFEEATSTPSTTN